MTKKDYIKIADVLKDAQTRISEWSNEEREYNSEIGLLKSLLIDMLEEDNPRFDRQRFIDHINNKNWTSDKKRLELQAKVVKEAGMKTYEEY